MVRAAHHIPRSRAWALVAALVLAGCSGSEPGRPPDITPELVWPAPPGTPRVRYVTSITGPRDLGLRPPWWRRVLRVVTGRVPEGMVRPMAVAAAGGRIAVADPGRPGVHLFTTDRYRLLTRAGDVDLVSPVGVALARGGVLFVADSALGRVFRFDGAGRPAGAIDDPELRRPTGLAWSESAGRLYVADTLLHRISVYDHEGVRTATFGRRGTRPGEFNYPVFLALGLTGEVLVSDTLNYRVAAFNGESASFSRSFGEPGDGTGSFARPKGIGVDSFGHIYVADALFDAVQVFEPGGRLLLVFGERGRGPGQFWMPTGLCVAGGDRIYVADAYNRRVQVFEYVGGAE